MWARIDAQDLSVVWCGVVWCGVVMWWCGVVWCGVVWCGVVWCGVVWCGVVWCGDVVVWCGDVVMWCIVVSAVMLLLIPLRANQMNLRTTYNQQLIKELDSVTSPIHHHKGVGIIHAQASWRAELTRGVSFFASQSLQQREVHARISHLHDVGAPKSTT